MPTHSVSHIFTQIHTQTLTQTPKQASDITVADRRASVSFHTGSLNSYGPCPKLILLPFFPVSSNISLNWWACSKSIGWPSPLAPLDTPWLIWKSWLYPSPWRYLHAALSRLSYRPFEVATQKMNNFPSPHGLTGDWGYSHTCVCALANFPWCTRGIEPRCQSQGSAVPLSACWRFTWAARRFFTVCNFSCFCNLTSLSLTQVQQLLTQTCWICRGKDPHSLG